MSTPHRGEAFRAAFVCAMPMELTPLRAPLGLTGTSEGPVEFYRGALGDAPVAAVVSGMGTARAARCVADLLDRVEVHRVLVVGIAGSLEADSVIGALLRPEAVVDAASGTRHVPEQLGTGVAHGILWTSDELVTDPDEAADLRTRGVVGLDMETAAVARQCEERRVPWSVHRCISDRVTDGIVTDELLRLSRPDGTADPRAVATHLVRHPGRVPDLVRMARAAKLAATHAAGAALTAVSAAPPSSA